MVVHPKPPVTRGQELPQVLEDHLAKAMGSRPLATAAIADAMRRAGRKTVPADPSELLTFAWAYLVGSVATMAGVREATGFVTGLQRALEAIFGSSAPRMDPPRTEPPPDDPAFDDQPSEIRSVGDGLKALLVDADLLGRAMLARALVRTGTTLVVADDLPDALARAKELQGAQVVYCSVDTPAAIAALSELLERLPRLSVIVRATDHTRADATMNQLGIARYDLLPARPTTAEAVSSILTLARAVRDEG